MLRVVHISEFNNPKTPAFKQVKGMEIQVLIMEQERKDRNAALRMTEKLKAILK